MNRPPTALKVQPENLPATLTSLPRWVAWDYEPSGQKWKKVPKDCRSRRNASVTDPASWSPFDAAKALLKKRKRDRPDGIGFVFTMNSGFVGVDLDDCRDPNTGKLEPGAEAIVREMQSYTEVSPSGTGVKLILRGKLPSTGRRKDNVEMYDSRRFFTMTGHRLPSCPADVMERGQALLALHGRVFPPQAERNVGDLLTGKTFPKDALTDDELIAELNSRDDGGKFGRLLAGEWTGYQSQSEADLALCGIFAREVGPNLGRVERLFGRSALASREKWKDGKDYRERTVGQAVEGLLSYAGPTTITLAMTLQDFSDSSRITQSSNGHSEDVFSSECLALAIARSTALAVKQGRQGLTDFRTSFDLARLLLKLSPNPEPVMPAVQAYCQEAGRPFNEFWLMVLDCWPRVKVAEGDGGWAWAERMAVEEPLDFLPGADVMPNRAASLAYYLSCLNEQFPFPVEKVGAAMGMSDQMGSIAIKVLMQRKVIERVRKADYRKGIAAEYRFIMQSPPGASQNGLSYVQGGDDAVVHQAHERFQPQLHS